MPPPTVVTDTDVTSAWGNAVVADLTTHTSQIAALVASDASINAALGGKAGLSGSSNYFLNYQHIASSGTSGGNPGIDKAGTFINCDTGQVRIDNDEGSTATQCLGLIVRGAAIFTSKRFIAFAIGTTEVGSVTLDVAGISVQYNTISDPRLKTPPETAGFAEGGTTGIADAATRIQQLGAKAWVGNWIDPITGAVGEDDVDFLSSWDIEDVAPYAVTGTRDAVAGPPQNETDPEEGSPVYQQVNYPALVPLLTAALSQALDRITALEATVAALQA